MRTESGNSLALERSMNLQCHIMTFEEALRNLEVIDKLDDENTEKLFGIMKWLDDMNIYFNKKLESILKINDFKVLKSELQIYKTEKNNFELKYKESFQAVKDMLIYYEELDDDIRNYLIDYAIKCRKELRIENSEIEKKLILENKERLLNKKRQD